MFHRTFNPGPSHISDEVKADIAAATEQNILGISHRSSTFIDITRHAAEGLRKYFAVPADYHVVLTSSATEALELTIRNLVEKESFHFTNGHFSEFFARTSKSFGKNAIVDEAEWGELNDYDKSVIPDSSEIVTITYNETSTGTTCSNQTIRMLHERLSEQLLVVDATSAAGCVPLVISDADVWLFSVQKGMGLPSGLGVIFISPRALKRSKWLHHAGIFNFNNMAEKMADFQTIQTPNVLGIYLLAKQLERWNASDAPSNYKATETKAKLLDDLINKSQKLEYFVKQPSARSKATVCIQAQPETVQRMHQAAQSADLVIGSGYGKLKPNTCRIATFPALSAADINLLIDVVQPVV
jgi:phosphoserine aminotransferase